MKTIYQSFFIALFVANQAFSQKNEVSVIGVGDIMLGSNYPSADYLPPQNGKHLLEDVSEILRNATVTFGNLEGTVLNAGGTVKNCANPNACYAFRMPEYLLSNLTAAGFDVLSIANNHVGDFGDAGRANTPNALKERNLKYAGLVSCPTAVFEKEGVKFGLAAFAPNTGTVNINDIPNAVNIVNQLKTKVDIVIVSFHGGAEGSGHQHIPRKNELYFGENRGNVHKFAHAVIDAGADIVFGHGPHVTRAVEVYKGRFIAYSLGNFCTYKQFSLKGVSGVAPIIKVYTDRQGKFLRAQVTPIYQLPSGGTKIDKQRQAIEILQALTKADFPESKIKINDEGLITLE